MAQFGVAANPLLGSEIINVLPVTSTGLPAANTGQTTVFGIAQTAAFGVVQATALTLTNSATLTQVPSLILNVNAGATYVLDLYLSVSASAGGGIAINLGQGTTTAATATFDTWIYNTSTVAAQGNTLTLTGNLTTFTGLATAVTVQGSFTATKTGTLAVFAAQNVGGNASSTTINVGSYVTLQRTA